MEITLTTAHVAFLESLNKFNSIFRLGNDDESKFARSE